MTADVASTKQMNRVVPMPSPAVSFVSGLRSWMVTYVELPTVIVVKSYSAVLRRPIYITLFKYYYSYISCIVLPCDILYTYIYDWRGALELVLDIILEGIIK